MILTQETPDLTAETLEPAEETNLPHWEDAAEDYKVAQLRLQAARSSPEQTQALAALEHSRAILIRIFDQIWPGRDT